MNVLAIIYLVTLGAFVLAKGDEVKGLIGAVNGFAGLGLAIWVVA